MAHVPFAPYPPLLPPGMIFWDRADQHIARRVLAGTLVVVLVTIPSAAVICFLSQPHIAMLSSTIPVLMLTTLAGIYLRLAQARHAHQLWRHQEGAATFLPSARTMAWNLLELLIVPCGCLLLIPAAITMLLTDMESAYPWTVPGPVYIKIGGALLMSILIAVLVGVALAMPAPRPGVPAIALTPHGVWLWPRNRRHTWIPWDCCPALTMVHRRGDAVITTFARGNIRFPMVYLPLRYTQLHHVLELFVTRPDLRPALAGPEGITLVQTAMCTPVDPAERRLPGAVGGSV